jgi:hypothetical protein
VTQSPVHQRFDEWWEEHGSRIIPWPLHLPREWVLFTVVGIAEFDPITPPPDHRRLRRAERERLNQYWEKVNDLVSYIQSLTPEMASLLGAENLVEPLTRFRDAIDHHRNIPHSGRPHGDASVNKIRKQLSALFAIYVLTRTDVNIVPSLTRGPYIPLAEAFYNMATGREADLYQVCRNVLRSHERQQRR